MAMLGGARQQVVDTLAEMVASLRVGHPVRVGIDGRSAAGKTTLADELAEAVRGRGREVLRASIDDFHPPGYKLRSQRGAWTARSKYDEGYDYAAFRELLLEPLGPGGTRRCHTTIFDSFHDAPVPEVWQEVGAGAVVIVDGACLLRLELASHWEYLVWLDIDVETMVERARRRDVAWVGSEAVVEERYRRVWMPTHELYEDLTDAPARSRHDRQPRPGRAGDSAAGAAISEPGARQGRFWGRADTGDQGGHRGPGRTRRSAPTECGACLKSGVRRFSGRCEQPGGAGAQVPRGP